MTRTRWLLLSTALLLVLTACGAPSTSGQSVPADEVTELGTVPDDEPPGAIADGSDAVAVDAAGIEQMAAAISPLDEPLAAEVRGTDPSQAFVVAFHHDSCASPETTTAVVDGHPTFTVDTQGTLCVAPIPTVAVAAVSWTAVADPAEVVIVVDGSREVIATIADREVTLSEERQPSGAEPAGPLEGELLVSVSVDPDVAEGFPRIATDPASRQAMVDAITVEGRDATAVADADLGTSLVAAFDLGECTTGDAQLVLRDGELVVEGRESDGVCEAIDHEVQVWRVPRSAIPDGTTVDGMEVSTADVRS